MTFLGNQESSRSLYAIPGLDYVAHDDIIPYASVERVPLQHELFDKFLMHNSDKGNYKLMRLVCLLITGSFCVRSDQLEVKDSERASVVKRCPLRLQPPYSLPESYSVTNV